MLFRSATGAFAHGGEDWQLFQNIQKGIAGTQMPPSGLSNEETWQLITYLRGLSGTAAEETVPGDPGAGEKIFAGKGGCPLCH